MTGEAHESEAATARVGRARHGRLIGGVCAGLPEIWGLGTNGLRLAFVVAGLCGGVGVIVYLACWLVMPTVDEEPDTTRASAGVLVAWGMLGVVVVTLLAGVGALATVFGGGWIVVALAALLLVAAISGRTRLRAVVPLLGVAALTLPAVGVALSPVRLTLQTGDAVTAPPNATTLRNTTYRSGFGTSLIDLRQTRLPRSGTVTLTIDAGLRRTIVALPPDRCVHVRVDYDVHPFAGEFASLLSGRSAPAFPAMVLFGRVYGDNTMNAPHGVTHLPVTGTGPTLDIDFSSQGGGLFVRDYPQDVDPDTQPNWPGFVVHPEPRPNLRGEPRAARRQMLRDWRRRLRHELASQRRINRLLPGPCA